MHEGMIEIDEGVQLWYRSIGNASDIVLVPNGFHLQEDFQYLAAGRRLVFYDTRNRGRSSTVVDASKLARGIHHDVDDLDVVRRYFAVEQVDVIGHSYVGLTAIMCAMSYPTSIRRVVAIGAMGPRPTIQYPPPLSNPDATLREVVAELKELQAVRAVLMPDEFCKKFWAVLRRIYVTNPADADKIQWSRCDLPNELHFMEYWTEHLLPSLNALAFSAADFWRVHAPVLVVHGTKDRSAPYGGGREWALSLPYARLLAAEGAGHAPWVEQPALVFGALRLFLEDGAWPAGAELIQALDPGASFG